MPWDDFLSINVNRIRGEQSEVQEPLHSCSVSRITQCLVVEISQSRTECLRQGRSSTRSIEGFESSHRCSELDSLHVSEGFPSRDLPVPQEHGGLDVFVDETFAREEPLIPE